MLQLQLGFVGFVGEGVCCLLLSLGFAHGVLGCLASLRDGYIAWYPSFGVLSVSPSFLPSILMGFCGDFSFSLVSALLHFGSLPARFLLVSRVRKLMIQLPTRFCDTSWSMPSPCLSRAFIGFRVSVRRWLFSVLFFVTFWFRS